MKVKLYQDNSLLPKSQYLPVILSETDEKIGKQGIKRNHCVIICLDSDSQSDY